MTVTGQTPRQTASDGDPAARQSRRRDATAVREVCPYLAVEDGSWRSAYAAREHRCQAVTPPAPLTIDKQRGLCLQPAHESCATFLAARAVAAEANPPGPGDDGASLWPASGSAPVVLEPARRMGALPTASAAPTASAVDSPTPDPTAAPSATPGRTPSPTATPAHRRYRVKSGDTMSSIAARYGTTVKKLAALNNIADPRVLHAGQVLLIP